MRSDDGNIGSHTYFWYDSGCCSCVDEGQPHKSGIQTGTDVHLDLERNPADGAGISDIDLTDRKVVVAEGDKLSLGKHELINALKR